MRTHDSAVFVEGLVELRCPRGHALTSFQTNDLGGRLPRTYLVHGDRLYVAEAPDRGSAAGCDPEVWRIETDDVVRERRFTLREIKGPLTVDIATRCDACLPLPGRAATSGDAADSRRVCVRFRLEFRPGEPVHVERLFPAGW